MRNPEFPGFFFIHEHLGRFFTAQHGRGEPLWYFVPIVLGGMFPWSFFLPAAIMAGIRARRAEPGIFLLIWACVIIIFFSLSGSKLPPYVLPAFPSMALLLGRGFSRAFDRGISLIENQGRALAVSLCVGSAGVAAYGSLTGGASLSRTSSLAIAALLLLGGVIVVRTVRGGNPAALFLGVWLIACTVGSAGPVFARGTLHEKRSLKELALIVRDNAGSAAVYSYGFYAQDLPFYAKRRVGLVGVTSELAFGRAQEKKHSPWFITYRTFYKLWDSGRPTVTMIDGNDMPLLLKSVKSPVRVLGRKGRKELIANR
jgi:4-amino-4-deoxy-L-arabinose transferase-like glycosyltransferase